MRYLDSYGGSLDQKKRNELLKDIESLKTKLRRPTRKTPLTVGEYYDKYLKT